MTEIHRDIYPEERQQLAESVARVVVPVEGTSSETFKDDCDDYSVLVTDLREVIGAERITEEVQSAIEKISAWEAGVREGLT